MKPSCEEKKKEKSDDVSCFALVNVPQHHCDLILQSLSPNKCEYFQGMQRSYKVGPSWSRLQGWYRRTVRGYPAVGGGSAEDCSED